MKRKLVLVNPVNPGRTGLTVNKITRFPPLGLGIVAALTPDHWEVELVDENWKPFTYRHADLVGITAFTAAANRAYQIAAVYREKHIPVVMGGIHASFNTNEALKYVDAVVVGEVEKVWSKVVADAEAGQLQQVYQGEWPELTGLPRPRRDLFHRGYTLATVQTSRGCPMDCEFCSVTAFNGRRYRRRPVDEVLDELETVPQKMIFFIDDNIIGYGKKSRDQALALFKGMVERKMNKWWFSQASLNLSDDEEVLHWAHKAGCKMVYLGLEAEKTDTLEEMNKRVNVNMGGVAAYDEAFRRIHKAGISVLGAFIFGLDTDTKSKLHQRADYVVGSGVDVIDTTFLTPLPGTRLFARFQKDDRLLYTNFPADWDRYHMGEVVYKPNQMSPADLLQTKGECNRKMYGWPTLVRKAWQALRETRDPIAMAFTGVSNLSLRKVVCGGASAIEQLEQPIGQQVAYQPNCESE
jgi:radical SAM superfamily enzyme YgiQ (UPF0313 family)